MVALTVCATLMLLCFMYCLFRTAEDVCPYDLYLFRCLAVSIAFRRDVKPRPTGCAALVLLCFMYCLFRTAEDVCPYDLCLGFAVIKT